MIYRSLTDIEISRLESYGCSSRTWGQVMVADGFSADDIANIRNVRFEGEVHLGTGVRLENIGIIRTTDGATFGENVLVSVKNEAGDGNVVLFSALSSQLAALMMRYSGDAELFGRLRRMVTAYVAVHSPACTTIGKDVSIFDCRELTNVSIGDGCELSGVSRLVDCTLAPTPDATINVGDDVICENVIMQAGATVVDGAKLYDTFVGEACHIGRGFTSENSLFFANSYMDNGEACAALCGPFTVSHHKSTLLIGGEHSFYNAGSNTNFSNHAYKLGPVHYGTMERGSKTASGAHILWPAQIGAFSMVMGKVQTHPDTSMLPFSYVIGEGRHTYVVPGINLCTVGTYRDVNKWPKRDARPAECPVSLVTFDWLSPYVVQRIKAGIAILEELQEEQGYDAEEYTVDGFTIKASALQHGLHYYDLALRMYGDANVSTDWTDLLGLLAPTDAVDQLCDDIRNEDITDIETLAGSFRDIYDSYDQWKGYSDNEAEMNEAREEWLAAIRRDAEKEYAMGDVGEELVAGFLQSLQ